MCLVGVAPVGSVATFNNVSAGSAAGYGVGLNFGILSKFFIGNNLLLKLLITFLLY